MAPGACLALALGLVVPAENAVAPLGTSHAASGSRVDLVVRSPEGLRTAEPAPFKLLLSDAVTDAPVESARISLQLFGPKGLSPILVEAGPGSGPGSYVASTLLPKAGRYALVADVRQTKTDVDYDIGRPHQEQELLGADGPEVRDLEAAAPQRSPLWPFALGVAAALLLFAAVRRRGRPAVAALLLLGAGDARAHGAFTPPPAAVPGANVFLAQEIQFALGIRTVPAAVQSFAPARGVAAARKFLGVPRSAVVERDGHKLIFVRTAPEHFVAREPKLGWTDQLGGEPWVAVLGGLDLDEKVVVEGAAFLRNGGAASLEAGRAGQALR